jgi:hypothetical protein
MRMRRPKAAEPINAVKAGVAAGAAGTSAMTAAQMAYYKATRSQPSNVPVQVARRIASGVLHRDLPPPQGGVDAVLNNAMHWIYGTSWGALFALAAAGRRPGAGIVFGLVVWGASLVHLPAMKLAPPVWEQDPETIAPDVGFHLLYGTATAAAYRAMR